MAIRTQQRHGEAADWTSVNPILAVGEWGVETDLLPDDVKAKLGDGVTAWVDLAYVIDTTSSGGGTWGSITGTLANQLDLAAALAAKVPTSRTVNGQALNGNVTLSASDVGADASGSAAAAQAAAATDATTKANAAQSAAQSYADTLVVGLVDDRGNYNASVNTFPASGGSGSAGAVLKGDLWTVSVAGTLGGNAVTAGDLVRALVDAPGQTAGNWAVTENNIGYVAENAANKDTDGTLAANSDTKYPSQKAAKTYIDTAISALSSVYQAASAVLSAFVALTPSNDDFLQRKAGAWANRTVAQVKTDLGLTGTNSGDQTSVSGNAGTATALATARNIGGISFDGTANIEPGVSEVAVTTGITLGLTHRNKILTQTHASPQTIAIPAQSSVTWVGPTTVIIMAYGAGTCTLDADPGVTLNGVSGGSVALNRYQNAVLRWISSDVWVVSGTSADVA